VKQGFDAMSGPASGAVGTLFFSAFLQSSEAIVLSRAHDGVIVDVNQEWVNLTGFSRHQAIGRTTLELGHWPDASARAQVLSSLWSVGRVTDQDVTLIMHDGGSRLVRLNATVVDEQCEKFILVYLRDVTADRLASEALRAGERVLAQANESLNRQITLYEMTETMAKVGYLVTTPDDPQALLSGGYADIFGLGSERTVELKTHLLGVHEDDRDAVLEAMQHMDGQTLEYRWHRPDGVQIWIRSRMRSESGQGGIKACCVLVQDISAERQAVQAVADQLAATQDSEARFRALTALSSDWYWEQDENFRFVRVDGHVVKTGLFPVERYLGKTLWEGDVSGVTPAQWADHRAELEAHEPFHDFELQHIGADGITSWVSVSGAPIFDALGAFRGYRGTGRDINQRKQAEFEIERLAFFDALTGLPNRRLLLDRLNLAVASTHRKNAHGALMFIDLDNFKMLNDTLGHNMGDELLKQVATRLAQCVRGVDTVARLGGDEFVIMLQELSEDEFQAGAQAEAVGSKILSALNVHYQLGAQLHHSSPSMGITLFYEQRHSVDELLKRADLAMYQAKAAGRNTFRFFDPNMQAAASARALMEVDMRLGLERKEFLLYYQPVVNEHSTITGVEALLRWQHPTRGMVSPGEFIPVAEQAGLILPLGQWVLEAACAQLVAWNMGATTRKLTIAVNVSARQFRHPEFTSQLLSLLRTTGANPYRLKLELTESMLLNDFEDVIIKMGELRSIGVNFALDDFGTGYSSLSYLKRLPLDQLKIDQSFVRDVLTDSNDAVIARTIMNLAHSLDLSVVAEGVETTGQRDFLLKNGCKAFQGYLFGRPMPVEQLDLTLK
jgi:diguanylate cyclase (GGDEF)-like protein/PAS domain S-box-containing protein